MSAQLSVNLPRDGRALALARRAVAEGFASSLSPRRLDEVLLTVTELVSNALKHGHGQIRLKLAHEEGRLAGEVVDDGGGFEHEVRRHGADEVGGKGLLIVSALTSRWGIHEGSSHVWFEMDDEPTIEPSEPELGEEHRPDLPS
jgi:anti-sigma regulatory factor (Ser/Thr protein kinase)